MPETHAVVVQVSTFDRLDQIPRHWAAVAPDAIALRQDSGRWTYSQFCEGIDAAKATLSGLHVEAGDRVLLVAENCVTLVCFVFAVSELKAISVLVNARQSPSEIDAIAGHAQPQVEVYIAGGETDGEVHGLRRGAGPVDCDVAGIVRVRATGLAAGPDAVPLAQRGLAALIYTSGTTGTPKGVMLTHRGLLFVALTMRDVRQLSTADCSYAVLPLSHTIGLTSVLLSTLSAGGSVLLRSRFDVSALVRALEDGVSLLQGVPAMYSALLAHLRLTGSSLGASRLRYIYAGGSPMDPTLKREVESLFGLPLHNGYGMTESSPTLCHSPFDQHRDDVAVGPPIPGVELRIVDSAGIDLPAGRTGEIRVRSPGVMLGYFRDPVATASALQDGWLCTGDLARLDGDGCVHLVGRLKDMIIRSGFNVYPAEVEAAINAHDSIAQSAVVGRIADRNEEVVAFVRLRPGAQIDEAHLGAHLRDRLTAYKRPTRVIVLDSFPTLPNGKVDRSALKQTAQSLEAPPADQ